MNKFSCLKILQANGDSVIDIMGDSSIVGTTDFSTKYIKAKRYGKYNIEKNAILVFSWTDDKFRSIATNTIKSIKPLSDILGNVNHG